MSADEQISFYEAVGGDETFRRLVRRFYEEVATDPVLRPLYPGEDLGPAEDHLRMFLIQYWGGPRTYSDLRGHPRLRMRHAPFKIDQKGRDRWVALMEEALAEAALPADAVPPLRKFFHEAATFMINHA